MIVTETEETVDSDIDESVVRGSTDQEAGSSDDDSGEHEVANSAGQADLVDVTMVPPGGLDDLLDLATKSVDRLGEAADQVKTLAQSQQQAVEQAGELAPALKKTMEEAAAEALESGGQALKAQLDEAAAATTTALQTSLTSSQETVEQMQAATASFSTQIWRNALLASLGAAGIGLVAVLLAGWLMTWWVRADVEALREERRELTTEISALKETAEDWASRFGRADVSACAVPGGGERLCVRIDDRAGNFRGEKGEHYRVLWGY